MYHNHRQYFPIFDLRKNGTESLLESQMNTKYDFLSILSLLFRRWNGVLWSQKVKNLLNRVENFFLKRVMSDIKKIRLFYVDYLVTKCT
jgi:hypothetical protein